MSHKRSARFGVLAVLLATVLTIGPARLASATTGVKLFPVSGPSPYAACTVGAGTGTNYVNAEVEPQVAANPANSKNIIGAWQQDRWSNGGSHGLVAGSSFDGGRTWTETTLPFSSCAPGGLPYERASDPWVSIGPDGTAYANAISFDRSTNRNAVAAVTSTDGGKTWDNLAVLVAYNTNGGQFSTDKNSITADPVKPSVAYSVWDTLVSPTDNPDDNPHTAAYTGNGYFSKTTDGGRTWSVPQIIFPTANRTQTIGNVIVVDPRTDALYDFTDWIVQPNSAANTTEQAAFVKSLDGGKTWTAPQVIAQMFTLGVRDPNTGALIRVGDGIPEATINPATGQLYVVWEQSSNYKTGNSSAFDNEMALATSTDGGATWAVTQSIANHSNGLPEFTPTVAVNSVGTVAVSYYDFRNLTPGNTTTLPTDYWLTTSSDGGTSFGNETHITGSFDMLTAPYARGYFVGDYQGLTTIGTSFQPFFVQTTGDLNNRNDVFTTTI